MYLVSSDTLVTVGLINFSFFSLSVLFQKGNIIDLPKDEDTPEKRVDKIFKQMDKVCREYY